MVSKEDKLRLEDEKARVYAEMELAPEELEAVDALDSIHGQIMGQVTDILHHEFPKLSDRQVMRVQLAVLRASVFWVENFLNREE